MEASMKMQPMLCTSKPSCHACPNLSACRQADCYPPIFEPLDEGRIKPHAQGKKRVSVVALPNICCWERSEHNFSRPHPRSSQSKARNTAQIHAACIPSTTTVCAHGIPVSVNSLAICSPASLQNTCDYKNEFNVPSASDVVSVKRL